MAEDLYTAGKLAQQWGVSPKAVKEAIEKAGVQPDQQKGVCKYYGKKTVEKIKANLPK